ncbi:MAG: VWA domain-containing protein [Streptomycetaceae bacterium]|nr:VWA domain-containing protein [Streptomycetaceae bacterium]
MEAGLHRFIRLLRQSGPRVSASETVDAMRAAAQPGMLGDREALREALRLTLIKDRRDDAVFDELFNEFFAIQPVTSPTEVRHGHSHRDLSDTGELQSFTIGEEPSPNARPGHSHGPPKDLRDYFDRQDLSQQYNRHQEANRIDLAAATPELVLAPDEEQSFADGTSVASVELTAEHLHNPGIPGRLSRGNGLRVGTELTIAESSNNALPEESEESEAAPAGPGPALPHDRADQAPEGLSELLARHLAMLAELTTTVESRAAERVRKEQMDEADRRELEESLRRMARTLPGAPTAARRDSPRGRAHSARTMRRNMRYDGVPFRPVTTSRTEDAPRLLVLADVSLSVRATARFILQLAHGLQSLFAHVRSFAFVDEPVEVTELFAEHSAERALSLFFDGLPTGELLDVDADSDYGRTFETMLAEHRAALTRKTTLIVLGDGRGNGHDPRFDVFEEITRRLRQIVWLTPEPQYSWRLGGCDLPAYAEYCDQVHVVNDLTGLEGIAHRMAQQITGQ